LCSSVTKYTEEIQIREVSMEGERSCERPRQLHEAVSGLIGSDQERPRRSALSTAIELKIKAGE
jgi:hypothetical protein